VSDRARADIYFSLDVEADGPIPGPYSMLSLGVCVAAHFDGTVFTARNPRESTFYSELKPISDAYDRTALKVARLDREALARDGCDPARAMHELRSFITASAGSARPVVCAYPAGFDWTFLYWYLVRFGPAEPILDFNSVFDMKTMYAVRAGVPFDQTGLNDLPLALRGEQPHTHNALDDAVQQAEVFCKLFAWHA
jgi:hypothetical protein